MKSLTLLTVLLVCVLSHSGAAQAAPEIALVVALQGGAMARHANSPPRPLTLYSPLFAGDSVVVAAGGRVTLRFCNGQSRTLTPASPRAARRLALPAASNSPLARIQRAVFDDQCSVYSRASRDAHTFVRGYEDPPPLEALRPRGVALRTGLVFQWTNLHPGPVQVRLCDGAGRLVWQQAEVAGEHLAYPADAPRLAAGQEYQWSVSDGVHETPHGENEAKFETADADRESRAVSDLSALNHLAFASEEERHLTRAALLARRSLYDDALSELPETGAARLSPLAHAVRLHAWMALGETDMAAQEHKALGEGDPAICRQWEPRP